MIKRAIILILVGFFVSIISHSCGSIIFKVKWFGFKIELYDASGDKLVLLNVNEIINRNVLLCFQIIVEDSTRQVPIHASLNLITQCMATSIDERYERIHTPVSITVKTIFDYSERFPAGSDITSLFKASINRYTIFDFQYPEYVRRQYISINELILKLDELKNSWSNHNMFHLYLMDNTYASGQQQFEIGIVMSDGAVFVQQTEKLMME